jgi:hypothetical protein
VNALGLLEDRGRLFRWKNRVYDELYRYFLEGAPQWDGYNVVGSVKLTHTLGPTASYEIQASITHDNVRRGFSDDNNDGVVSPGEDGEYLTWADTAQVYRYMSRTEYVDVNRFFGLGGYETIFEFQPTDLWLRYEVAHPNIYFDDFTHSVGTLRLSGSALVHPSHLLQAGVEARFHILDKTLRAGGMGGRFPEYKNYTEEMWTRRPKEFNFYLLDRMEFEGLYLNLGLRVEVVDLDAAEIADWYAPFADGVDESGGPVCYPVRGESVPLRVFLSPRIGVSHPISDYAAMYFSFSRSQRHWPYSVLYSNYNNYSHYAIPHSRVSQAPITSLEYDLGIQCSIFRTTAFTIGAYYKEYQDYRLRGIQATPTSGFPTKITTPGLYVDVRGVELELNQKPVSMLGFLTLAGRFAYALSSVMEGTPARVKPPYSAAAGDSALHGGEIPFDDVHYWDKRYLHVQGGSYLRGGLDRKHRITFQLFMQFPLDIHVNALGRFASGFYFAETVSHEVPDFSPIEGPWNKQVDLRLEKGFQLGGLGRLSLFVDVINLFNWVNIVSFQWGATQSQEGKRAWEELGDPTGGPEINRPTTIENVPVYDVPREVYFGLAFQF